MKKPFSLNERAGQLSLLPEPPKDTKDTSALSRPTTCTRRLSRQGSPKGGEWTKTPPAVSHPSMRTWRLAAGVSAGAASGTPLQVTVHCWRARSRGGRKPRARASLWGWAIAEAEGRCTALRREAHSERFASGPATLFSLTQNRARAGKCQSTPSSSEHTDECLENIRRFRIIPVLRLRRTAARSKKSPVCRAPRRFR